MGRPLTSGETSLLLGLFREMLPYDKLMIKINKHHWGGKGNSMTPSGVPYMSELIYVADFAKASPSSQWTFIHEYVHVWQYAHGQRVKTRAIALWMQQLGRYKNSYDYSITSNTDFYRLNIEQQASMVADYWYVTLGHNALHNVGSTSELADYTAALSGFWNAGPATHGIGR